MTCKAKEFQTDMRTVLIITVLIVYVIAEICQGSLLKGPVNTTISDGERVILHCQTDLTYAVYWYFNEEEVFAGGKISQEHSSFFDIEIKGNTSEYNLVIPSASGSYNGLYTCADDDGQGDIQTAWLTVIDSSIGETTASQKTGSNVSRDVSVIVGIVFAVITVIIVIIAIIRVVIIICQGPEMAVSLFHGEKGRKEREGQVQLVERRLLSEGTDEKLRESVTKVKFIKRFRLPDASSTTSIRGITKLQNGIYILCKQPKYVFVFGDQSSFERFIPVEEIGNPNDIASSRKSECFYIVDRGLKTIWEKKTTDDSPLTKWSVELIEPVTLSISNDDRLLVLDRSDPANLVIFGLDGNLLKSISCPVEVKSPLHCIEKPNGGFIISESGKISELSSDGKNIIRQYHPNDASEELKWSYYMSLVCDGNRLFVADQSNNRVILLDSNSLQWKNIDIKKLKKPFRLLYDSSKKQLIVGHYIGYTERLIDGILNLFRRPKRQNDVNEKIDAVNKTTAL